MIDLFRLVGFGFGFYSDYEKMILFDDDAEVAVTPSSGVEIWCQKRPKIILEWETVCGTENPVGFG